MTVGAGGVGDCGLFAGGAVRIRHGAGAEGLFTPSMPERGRCLARHASRSHSVEDSVDSIGGGGSRRRQGHAVRAGGREGRVSGSRKGRRRNSQRQRLLVVLFGSTTEDAVCGCGVACECECEYEFGSGCDCGSGSGIGCGRGLVGVGVRVLYCERGPTVSQSVSGGRTSESRRRNQTRINHTCSNRSPTHTAPSLPSGVRL